MNIPQKLFSGRYFCTLAIVSTYCLVILGTIVLAIQRVINVEVFLGLFTGFSTLAGTIVTGYFNRTDRKENGQ